MGMKLIFLFLFLVSAQNRPADPVCANAGIEYVKKWNSKEFDMKTFKLEETRAVTRLMYGTMKRPVPEVPFDRQMNVIFSHLIKGNKERCYGAIINLEFEKTEKSCLIKRVLDIWPGDCRQEP